MSLRKSRMTWPELREVEINIQLLSSLKHEKKLLCHSVTQILSIDYYITKRIFNNSYASNLLMSLLEISTDLILHYNWLPWPHDSVILMTQWRLNLLIHLAKITETTLNNGEILLIHCKLASNAMIRDFMKLAHLLR